MKFPKMKFPKDNKLLYAQNFAYLIGVPSDVEFEIVKAKEGQIWLKGPGYGDKPYGDGPICLFLKTKV